MLPAPENVKAAPADATTTPSGLAYIILDEGTGGEHPQANSKVKVHYTGWMTNGKMFDSSVVRGEPISFGLDQVIKGWTEGVQKMKVGQKARFWIPGKLAYGDTPPKEGYPYGTLVFDIELLSFTNPPPPPEVPEDVAAAPKDALTTATGLAYKVISKGKGGSKPTEDATVTVHYTGWTTDGKMFDSSVTRGETIDFPLKGVIAGWTEGVQLMEIGEKTRFWIPEELAYKGQKDAPAGMLVFDIELISFQEPPKTPSDVAAAPADAITTSSGLAYKVLQKGTGDTHPTAASTVEVHYTGWMTNGEMFDSSVVRGETISFPLSGVIAGWTEGVQKMVVGEKTRFWIPGKLAYGETPSRPGYPYGTLVFDVELIGIS